MDLRYDSPVKRAGPASYTISVLRRILATHIIVEQLALSIHSYDD